MKSLGMAIMPWSSNHFLSIENPFHGRNLKLQNKSSKRVHCYKMATAMDASAIQGGLNADLRTESLGTGKIPKIVHQGWLKKKGNFDPIDVLQKILL